MDRTSFGNGLFSHARCSSLADLYIHIHLCVFVACVCVYKSLG